MTVLPEINFHQIRGRAPSGSQRDGFEELCSQLMISGDLIEWPPDVVFSVFGNPDGGREGRGLLPDGTTWCWQAKYLFNLGAAEFGQIDESVRTALKSEPQLARYYVVLPYDRPASDRLDAKSAFTKWEEHVKKWKAAAVQDGRSVKFFYLGEHQLKECLIKSSQVGRLLYWFDIDGFSEERFRDIAARAESAAGPRYSPELNVELPVSEVFDGLGRTEAFQNGIRSKLGALRAARDAYGLSIPEVEKEQFRTAIDDLDRRLDQLDDLLQQAIARASLPDTTMPDLAPAIEPVQQALSVAVMLLQEHCLRDNHYVDNAASLATSINKIRSAVGRLVRFTEDRMWRSADQQAILVTGTGGSGKTHLLCDLAKIRIAQRAPTLIALGEQFTRGPVEDDLSKIVGFAGPSRHLLAAFNVACQTAGRAGLVIIDALNEAPDRQIWRRYLGSFLNELAKHSHLRLIVSCRTEFLADTLTSELRTRMTDVTHTGFSEVSREAIQQFLDWYGIQRPSFPLLDPEFTNPLFLKLLCTTLRQSGQHRFPRDGVGTTWIYDGFLSAMDARLGAENRCDYDSTRGLVRAVVEQIASTMMAQGRRLPRQRVEPITSQLLPGRPWSSDLLNGLLKEGVLAEGVVDGTRYVRFGYERLGDVAIARLIAARGLPEVEAACRTMAQTWYRHAGELQALASVLPETHGVELMDVLEISTDTRDYNVTRDFLGSLAYRRPESVTGRTVELARDLLGNHETYDDAVKALVQVASVPDHALNAIWLHHHLKSIPLRERDATWSFFCTQQAETDGPISALILWAWSDASETVEDDVRYLAALLMSWALSSSHRPTRDNSTKALVALLEKVPTTYQRILHSFHDIDDDYIEERLLAVGCGIAQRTMNPDVLFPVADAIRAFTLDRNYWPENLHSRDYARRAIEAALEQGWNMPAAGIAAQIQPPYTSVWTQDSRSIEDIRALAGPPGYAYSAVSHPLMSNFDDFRKHVVDPAVRSFDLRGEADADLVARLIFDHVLTLGWTPEIFQNIDKYVSRRFADQEKQYETFAQKYIWIAFKQILGRLTDHYQLSTKPWGQDRTQYQTPLDVHGHDIDPTLLLRRTENRVYDDTPSTWFAPMQATFPQSLDAAWATNDAYAPRVDQLLFATDQDGSQWLPLEGHYQWSQPQHPEDAATGTPHHQAWAQIRSYIINADDARLWAAWARGQDFDGRWMPESAGPTGLLLADHPYKSDWPDIEGRDGHYYDKTPPPNGYTITTVQYCGLDNDWDQSDSKHLHALMPATAMCKLMGLQRADDFRWEAAGDVQAENFAAREVGPDSVHMRAATLVKMLRREHRCLIWTILARKETTSGLHDWPRDGRPVFRTLSASYLFDGTTIRLLDANSRTLHAGGGESNPTSWALPTEVSINDA
ncbi:NACHT domain-containing protein [Fodinicola acaciae]|uniref:NACHT domain-containing protein n=1 Tax=Fodinicola acaciae TaxID=2681555 RepID=UPI0013D5548F|nr:ATP-binding protein [Fodinicola acaciae]